MIKTTDKVYLFVVRQFCPFSGDSTIIAVSQDPKDKIVRMTTGIEINDKGLVEIDENGATLDWVCFLAVMSSLILVMLSKLLTMQNM